MKVTIEDKQFEIFISSEKIADCVKSLANQLDKDYESKDLLVLGILNGSFMFVSDLVKNMTIDPEISFSKFASYDGLSSTGEVKSLIGLQQSIEDRHVLIVEDIVDTGQTLSHIMDFLSNQGAASVKVATLFFKSEAYQQQIELDYVGMEIENKFVVGYGMDYNGHGRNLSALYQLCHAD